MPTSVINSPNGTIIDAVNVPSYRLKGLAAAIKGVPDVEGILLGKSQMDLGLFGAVNQVKSILGDAFPVIYDLQAGDDPVEIIDQTAKMLVMSGINAVMLFPFGGPKSQETWIKALQCNGLGIIINGVPALLKLDLTKAEYFAENTSTTISALAVRLGVCNFVMPGNISDHMDRYWHSVFNGRLGNGNYTLFTFDAARNKMPGPHFLPAPRVHNIVGSGIYLDPITKGARSVEEIRAAALELTGQIAG